VTLKLAAVFAAIHCGEFGLRLPPRLESGMTKYCVAGTGLKLAEMVQSAEMGAVV
jgi:hypothetical protein